jgi:hypothetical protein
MQFKKKNSKSVAANVDRQSGRMKSCKRRGISNLRERETEVLFLPPLEIQKELQN